MVQVLHWERHTLVHLTHTEDTPMTIRQTLAAIKAIHGMTAKWKAETREFRVAYLPAKPGQSNEAEAYYTEDADDAIYTADFMSCSRFRIASGFCTPENTEAR